jgi:alkylated DNA repair protein (DNA oxidative demethylase)
MNDDLFGGLECEDGRREDLAPGAVLLRGFARALAPDLLAAVNDLTVAAPFRHMVTPGGFRMSVAMSNCGALGWVSDPRGYRYSALDPQSGRPWPAMPAAFLDLARRAAATASFPDFAPDACLINRYAPGAKLSLHQDKDEADHRAPIVSVSLGLPAVFLFGGMKRGDPAMRIALAHGDVVVWGGPSRLRYHAVQSIKEGTHAATGASRINLTFRQARRIAAP